MNIRTICRLGTASGYKCTTRVAHRTPPYFTYVFYSKYSTVYCRISSSWYFGSTYVLLIIIMFIYKKK